MRSVFRDGRIETDSTVRRASESQFSFLERAPGPYWQRVRDLIEQWVSAYPASRRASMIRRLRLPSDRGHRGAWWELYVYSLFHALGASVQLVDERPGTKRPDFLVGIDGQQFYVEATTASGGIGETTANEARLIEFVNAIPHPAWLRVAIHVLQDGSSGEQPRRSEIEGPIGEWISRLSPTESCAGCQEERGTFQSRGWAFELTPLPARERDPETSDMRLIHIGPSKGGAVRDRHSLKTALSAKGTRYSDLEFPLVLAIALYSGLDSPESVGEALYGSEVVRFSIDSPDQARVERARDGLYMHTTGPQNTRVSGVLVGGDVLPWHLGRRLPDWWRNPWATEVVTVGSSFLSCVGTDNGEVVLPNLDEGIDPREVFGVGPVWPGPEKPFELQAVARGVV